MMTEHAGLRQRSRIALGVEYQGSPFYGWQRQSSVQLPTVQQALERALSRVANEPILVSAAGRTDVGVHATGQVIHFDTVQTRTPTAWVRGGNRYLPPEIAIQWAHPVTFDFHARYSALEREYQYCIDTGTQRKGCFSRHVWYHSSELDVSSMNEALQYLIGEHDFNGFRYANCQSKSSIRRLITAEVRRNRARLLIRLRANAFLHRMVRNIVGSLVSVGSKKFPPSWFKSILDGKDRRHAGVTAPAQGLYLTKVLYKETYGLPQHEEDPFIWCSAEIGCP